MRDLSEAGLPALLYKRDGSEVCFDAGKIARAIAAAGQATGEFAAEETEALTAAVLQRLKGIRALDVEQVQDRVERVLMDAGFYKTARAYIVYRERHGRLRRERRLTQSELADQAGVGRRFLAELEAGKETAQLGKALRVLAMLGVVVTGNSE